MHRRSFLHAVTALGVLPALGGCTSKAQKQADLCIGDLDAIDKLIVGRHLEPIPRVLPKLARALGDSMGKATVLEGAAVKAVGDALKDQLGKDDALRNVKRSYVAVVDARGEVVVVDDAESWPFLGRKIAGAFESVGSVIAGKADLTRGAGRYGGSDDSALTFVDTASIRRDGTIAGGVVIAWEAHDAAADLQRQRATSLAMETAQPKKRVTSRDRNKLILDAPDMWVAFARDGFVWFEDDVPQPLEEAVKGLVLSRQVASKTSNGAWKGTFDVMASSWGGAAKRVDALAPGLVVAVLRHDP